jgi:glycosyltransferase involved in cell wall biosynthesis
LKHKAAFIITARNKAKDVARAVQGALAQTYPCQILLSDQGSTDGTYEVMEKTVAETPMPMRRVAEPPEIDLVLDRDIKEVPRHTVELVRCPIEGPYGMRAANSHTIWLMERADADWVFQCSADDYSLPDRVRVCMEAVERHPCAAVACSMYFVAPGEEVGPMARLSAYPPESGYVSGGVGISKLVFGSTIQGWNREFFLKAGHAGDVTGDVYHGYLAAIDKGYYVVANRQHVHVQHVSMDNMGFGGKLLAAEASGDKTTINRINELNRFQLFELYYQIAKKQQELYPLTHESDRMPLINMLLAQACGWYAERKRLHEEGTIPWIM